MPKSTFSDAYAVLLEVLVDARRGQRMTQSILATTLGKPQSFIAKIENGERRIDVIEFCAVVSALGLDPAVLFAKLQARLPKRLEI